MSPSAIPKETTDHLPVSVPSKQNGTPHGRAGDVQDLQMADHESTDLVLRTFRCLIADLCQQFNGGHPG
ncbi:hypothetical protein LTS18_006488, partial [Coniosporium uncinatum]